MASSPQRFDGASKRLVQQQDFEEAAHKRLKQRNDCEVRCPSPLLSPVGAKAHPLARYLEPSQPGNTRVPSGACFQFDRTPPQHLLHEVVQDSWGSQPISHPCGRAVGCLVASQTVQEDEDLVEHYWEALNSCDSTGEEDDKAIAALCLLNYDAFIRGDDGAAEPEEGAEDASEEALGLWEGLGSDEENKAIAKLCLRDYENHFEELHGRVFLEEDEGSCVSTTPWH